MMRFAAVVFLLSSAGGCSPTFDVSTGVISLCSLFEVCPAPAAGSAPAKTVIVETRPAVVVRPPSRKRLIEEVDEMQRRIDSLESKVDEAAHNAHERASLKIEQQQAPP